MTVFLTPDHEVLFAERFDLLTAANFRKNNHPCAHPDSIHGHTEDIFEDQAYRGVTLESATEFVTDEAKKASARFVRKLFPQA